MKSVMTHSFSRTPTIEAPRSKFDRSFGHKTTMDVGYLVPLFWDPVLPGDTYNVSATIFARLSTPLFPIMDNMFLDTHYFFVPYRLLWDNFRKFCGEQTDPGDSIDYQIPILAGTTTAGGDSGSASAKLMDYLGVPHGISPSDVDISALPFRAYMRIWSEWFRDQNLVSNPAGALDTDNGPDTIGSTNYLLQKRGKRHDYFTSCLPWPQKGDAVSLPLGTRADVKGIGLYRPTALTQSWTYNETGNNPTQTTSQSFLTMDGATTPSSSGQANLVIDAEATNTGWPDIYADLTSATAATVNDLREAFQTQKLLERDARAGTRYSEIVRNHFSVDFYDISYRPEYLGGGSTPININPVAATTGSGTGEVTGDLAGFGTAADKNGFSKSFVEHGLVMCLVSTRADLTYQQGLSRHFSHSTRYDIYWPSLAHLGEQAVLNKEIYCDGTANDDLVFGYQERYAEYRYKPSMVTGLFKSATTGSLDAWHLSEEFSSLPTLGKTFIEDQTPLDRAVAVSSEPHFIVDSYIKMICARPMPVYGVPGMIDHF